MSNHRFVGVLLSTARRHRWLNWPGERLTLGETEVTQLVFNIPYRQMSKEIGHLETIVSIGIETRCELFGRQRTTALLGERPPQRVPEARECAILHMALLAQFVGWRRSFTPRKSPSGRSSELSQTKLRPLEPRLRRTSRSNGSPPSMSSRLPRTPADTASSSTSRRPFPRNNHLES